MQKELYSELYECTRDTDLKFVNKKTGEEIFVEVTEDNSGYVKKRINSTCAGGKKVINTQI